MSAVDLSLRTSCVLAKAEACVAGFRKLGHHFSADFTQDMVDALQNGAPTALYEHFVGQQVERLAGLEARHA